MRIGFRSFKPPLLADVSLIFACFSASRQMNPFEASNGFIRNHLRPKNTTLFNVSSVFYELFKLLHLSRDDERKSTCFTVFLCITIMCFALLDHKFWSNVLSRIALLAGLSPLPHFQRFSPPGTDECIR